MRTRNADAPKPTPQPKKTPPARKAAAKSTPSPSESATPKSAETKRVAATRGRQAKNVATPPTPAPTTESIPVPAVEVAKGSVNTEPATPKAASGSKPATRKARARTKTPTSSKPVPKRTPKSVGKVASKVEPSPDSEVVVDAKGVEVRKEDGHAVEHVEESKEDESVAIRVEEPPVTDAVESVKQDGSAIDVEEVPIAVVEESLRKEKNAIESEELSMTDVAQKEETCIQDGEPPLVNTRESVNEEDLKSLKNEKSNSAEDQVLEAQNELLGGDEKNVMEVTEESKIEPSNMEEDPDEDKVEEAQDELKEDKERKIMEVIEENKIESSNMEEDPDEDQLEEAQKELKADVENKIIEVTEEIQIETSNMEEDPDKDQVEEAQKELKADEEKKMMEVREESMTESSNMKEDTDEQKIGKDMNLEGNENQDDEVLEEHGNQEGLEEPGEEETAGRNAGKPAEEAERLEEEHMAAIAQERQIKREHEIFVGGLDRDALEEDIRKVFEKIGDVVDVRLHKSSSANQNKGYAFVKFANKEHATRALSEMKNPVICGKRCETAPSEDNNTLFLGNICNTWTKDAIKQKLKDYGLEGVESITLVPDAQREGLSRGFAFIEFSCHSDAMLAYKRLQKPDVIFGHLERTAKVAFAEPLREPNPEIMAQVKSVFIDGLPPHWDEDRVRNQFKGYGEIERIMLARNMSTAKRKDFGFVDFTTHEAAVACIESINNKELGDGNSKTKVRARLSSPLPKTQAVKGGMYGGFRIGHTGGGSFSKFGRGIGRGGHSFNQVNLQRGRGFHQRGRNQTGRMGFVGEYDFDNRYPELHARQNFERGGRGFLRGSYQTSSRGATAAGPSRPFLDRPRHNVSDVGRGAHVPPRRQPFSPEGGFDRPFIGSHFDDPYLYEDSMHGIKRPFHMTDQDPGYMEPSRLRPRLDYADPAVPFRGTHYRDTFAAGSDLYPRDYYGSNYGGGAYPPFYGGGPPHGGGYGGDRPYGGGYGGDRPYGGGYY